MNIRLLILFSFLSFSALAQTELRTGIDVSKNLGKKWSIQATGQTRFIDQLSPVATYMGEAGLSYNLTKNIEAGVYYRYMSRRKDDNDYPNGYYYRPYHRFFGEVEYGKKVGKIKVSDRLRYQSQFRDEDGETVHQNDYLRNKVEVSFGNKTKWKPSLAADVFYNLSDGFDKIRYIAGLQYSINKHNAIQVSGFKEQSLMNESLPRTVFSVGYKLKL